MSNRKYGYVRDCYDPRDLKLEVPAIQMAAALPDSVDLRPRLIPVFDQKSLGSCTGNALAAEVAFDQDNQHLPHFIPSRLFIYYFERLIEGTVGQDAGAQLRNGCKALATYGVPREIYWPYDISQFTAAPPQAVQSVALLHRALAYHRVPQTEAGIRWCLASGFPFVFGFTVFGSFETAAVAASGIVELPAVGENILGGHAVVAVGYDQASRRVICRNSWGEAWGDHGYFTMPYSYILDNKLADDLWVIRTLGNAAGPEPQI